MDKHEKILKEKLSRKLNPKFDEKFWDRAEREFPKLEQQGLLSWAQFSSLTATVLVIFSLSFFMNSELDEKEQLLISHNQELLEHYELLADMDDELFELNDKEWDVLLANI